MQYRSVLPIKIAKYGYILISLGYCVFGAAMLVSPAPSVGAIGSATGIMMLLFGIVKLIGYFSKDLYRLAFQFDLQLGILFVLFGLVTILSSANSMIFLGTIVGICILLDALFKIKISMDAQRFGIRAWWLTVILAGFAIVAGALTLCHPAAIMQLGVRILGLAIFIEGILNLDVAICFVKIILHQKPEIIDIDYVDIEED